MAADSNASAETTALDGTLFLYDPAHRLVAFQHGQSSAVVRLFIFVPGLTDGLLALPYIPALARAVARQGWTFVQPVLSSSYMGFGISSVSTDCAELDLLVDHMLSRHDKLESIALCGHSTGCQDIVTFVRCSKHARLVQCAILQGPVSDRDYLSSLPEFHHWLNRAETAAATGHGSQLLDADYRKHNTLIPAPITVDRFLSLASRGSQEDIFSQDLTDSELVAIYRHMAVPTLLCCSERDEYVPADVDTNKIMERIVSAFPHLPSNARILLNDHQSATFAAFISVSGGDHALSESNAQAVFVSEVQRFLSQCKS